MNIEQGTCFDLLHSSLCYSSATGMLIFEVFEFKILSDSSHPSAESEVQRPYYHLSLCLRLILFYLHL